MEYVEKHPFSICILKKFKMLAYQIMDSNSQPAC